MIRALVVGLVVGLIAAAIMALDLWRDRRARKHEPQKEELWTTGVTTIQTAQEK